MMHKTSYVSHEAVRAVGSPDGMEMEIEIPKSFTAPQLRGIAAALSEAVDKLEQKDGAWVEGETTIAVARPAAKPRFKVGDRVRSKLIGFVGYIIRIRGTEARVEASNGNYCTAELKDLEPAPEPAPKFNVGDRVKIKTTSVNAVVTGFGSYGYYEVKPPSGNALYMHSDDLEPAPEPTPQLKVTCHASGDRCHSCPHYHGKADVCDWASKEGPAPTDTTAWWEAFVVVLGGLASEWSPESAVRAAKEYATAAVDARRKMEGK